VGLGKGGCAADQLKIPTTAAVRREVAHDVFILKDRASSPGSAYVMIRVIGKDWHFPRSNLLLRTMPDPAPAPELPYPDTKPAGAADFYVAINATFRFIAARFGREGLLRYWEDLGRRYYAPVSDRWRGGGLQAVAAYWSAFFNAEPGAEVEVTQTENEVRVEVRTCPAIRHLREHRRVILPEFCQHCYFVTQAIGSGAGIEARVAGGNGCCSQTFRRSGAFSQSQSPEAILPAS
jgi:hypothetical protein